MSAARARRRHAKRAKAHTAVSPNPGAFAPLARPSQQRTGLTRSAPHTLPDSWEAHKADSTCKLGATLMSTGCTPRSAPRYSDTRFRG